MKKMRLIWMVLILLLIALGIGYSLSIGEYGIKAGVCVANQDFISNEAFIMELEPRKGIDVGLYGKFYDQRFLQIIAEMHYLQRGMVTVNTVLEPSFWEEDTLRISNRIDYLTLPFLMRISTETRYVALYAICGPRIDILLGDNSSMHSLYDDFRMIGIGGDVGFGIETGIFQGKPVLIEARYSHDFTPAFSGEFLTVKNYSFQILCGVGIIR